MAHVKMQEKVKCKIIQPDNSGASCIFIATSIEGLVGDAMFDVTGLSGAGVGWE